jgi:hypothetical protein
VAAGTFTILDLFDSLPWYKRAADWTAWRACLAATYGLPMTDQEYGIFCARTGRKDPPKRKVRELWIPSGRRARKSAVTATIGSYEAAFRDHRPYLASGELGRVVVIAKDRDDAGAIHNFCVSIFSAPVEGGPDPGLSFLLAKPPTEDKIVLTTQVEIVTRAARLTAGRSRAVVCALYDEIAFWPTDQSANPDVDIIRGVNPGMANIPGAITVGASSPHAKRGVLWRKVEEHYGQESDDVLVWMADTLSMHDTPEIRAYVQSAWQTDSLAAASEVGRDGVIVFRGDVRKLVTPEAIDAVTEQGVTHRSPVQGTIYHAFVDPSGGNRDSMTLSIAHWDGARAVTDVCREWPAPFSPDAVVVEMCDVLDPYRVRQVTGDHYGGEWPAERFRAHGVTYRQSELVKSEIYLEWLAMLNSGTVLLLDIPALKFQLGLLDRTPRKGGKDIVDHPSGGYDDVANAACGATVLAGQKRTTAVLPPVDVLMTKGIAPQWTGGGGGRAEEDADDDDGPDTRVIPW